MADMEAAQTSLLRERHPGGYALSMFRLPFRVLVVVVLGIFGSGCALLHLGRGQRRKLSDEELAAARRAPLAVGRISLVNVDDRFALIEGNLAQAPTSGTLLRAYSGNAVSAELRATGVSRRPFLVADLVSGMPGKGDLVVQPVKGTPEAVAATVVKPAEPPAPAVAPRWKRWLGFFRGRK